MGVACDQQKSSVNMKTLIDELNLLRESANAIQLRRNFEDSPMLYIPEVYSDYCSQNMMVMERIYGIPVSDVTTLEKNGTNMKLLAERGVQVFFTQVFRDSFSMRHAPGNILSVMSTLKTRNTLVLIVGLWAL